MTALILQNFSVSSFDPCVLLSKKEKVIVCIYIDDLLLFSSHQDKLESVCLLLHEEFEMTESPITYILGISVTFDNSGIRLSQQAYITKILERFQMSDSSPVTTPLEPHTTLYKGTPEDIIDNLFYYQSIIGSLIYAVIGTRSDLAYTVMLLSQFSSCPNSTHLIAAKRVLKYFKGTQDWYLSFLSVGQSVL